MKTMKDLTPPSGNQAPLVVLPYSRLILAIICLAILGWALLDSQTASAVQLIGRMS